MNSVTEARLERLKEQAGNESRRQRQRREYQANKDKGLVLPHIWIHPEDRKSLRDYASWLTQRREL